MSNLKSNKLSMKKNVLLILLLACCVAKPVFSYPVDSEKDNIISLYDALYASDLVFKGVPELPRGKLNLSKNPSRELDGRRVLVQEVFHDATGLGIKEGDWVLCLELHSTGGRGNIDFSGDDPSIVFVRKLTDQQLERYGISMEFGEVFGFAGTEGAIALDVLMSDTKKRVIESEQKFFDLLREQKVDRLRTYGFTQFKEFERCVSMLGRVMSIGSHDEKLALLEVLSDESSSEVRHQLRLAIKSITN